MFGATKKRSKKSVAATKPKRTARGWQNERERSAAIQSQKSQAGRDIGDGMPPVKDMARRRNGEKSFEFFCRVYFPDTFNLPWSNDHRRAIDRIEQAVRSGGLFAYAFPRGSGKTSLVESAVLWATLCGFRQFPLVIGSDESSALELLDSMRKELECNDLLFEDFPEVCYPIRRLEGIAHRANGQLFKGNRTYIVWTGKEIVLPTIPDSVASGAAIAVTGITGGFRGMKRKRPDGKSVRPDFVIIDDPQTDESAKSPSQCVERIKILSGAVLGLAGPGKKIAGVMPCTVIRPGDMADEILDRNKHPEWQGERTKLIDKFPDEIEGLWQQYRGIRAEGLRAGDGGKAGTEFYRANREAMDRGAQVSWPVRFNPDELSAIQHAMNLRYDLGDEAFFAEYQNDPLDENEKPDDLLTADDIAAKINGLERGELPLEATRVVAFIDVQKPLLYWVVMAFDDHFGSNVLDYGAYPDQKRAYFSLADAKRTLQTANPGKGLEAQIRAGLDDLTAILLSRKWQRADGAEMSIERCLIDANWGESSDVIYQFARTSPHSALLLPSHGRGVTASMIPFSEYKRKPGDRVGQNWRIPSVQGKRMVRHAVYDTNAWKSFVHARLAVPVGGVGGMALFGDDAQLHRLFAAHLAAEYPVPTEGRGRKVVEWKVPPSRPDQHWFDGVVGCCVAASIQGASLEESKQPQSIRRPAVKISDLQKSRKVWTPKQRM